MVWVAPSWNLLTQFSGKTGQKDKEAQLMKNSAIGRLKRKRVVKQDSPLVRGVKLYRRTGKTSDQPMLN
jgi:hypothetical protein